VGIRLGDGTEHYADVIVSAGDGYTTIFHMLGGDYVNDQICGYYDAAPSGQEHGVLVSLGVDCDLSGEPRAVTCLLDRPVLIAGEPRDRLTVEHYSFDPTMAPQGKSVLEVWLDSSYAYWKPLHTDAARYQAEKEQVATAVIAELERPYPGIRRQIEVVDVATPITIERYTGSWRGLEAWFPSTNGLRVMLRGLSRTLPGLDGFHMVGQWAGAAGGLPMAAISGRKLIQSLCRQDRRPFTTGIPGR
jgi:phytoene dehydrogenase-like protein